MDINTSLIRSTIKHFPSVLPHLTGKARWIALTVHKDMPYDEAKTVDFYLRQLLGLIRAVYNGDMRREFLDIMANLIQGQLTQAWMLALQEDNCTGGQMTDAMRIQLEGFILSEYGFVDGLYNDILNAALLKQPVDPFFQRARLWANRWNDVYNAAKLTIAAECGERLMWKLGMTEDHCTTCAALDGIVAFATEWEQLNVRPQSPPNPVLECSGWRCGCELVPTDKRRSPNALTTILNIVSR